MGVVLVVLALLGNAAPLDAGPREVALVRLAGSVQPASRAFLERVLAEAGRREVEAVVLELDTPGGLLVSLREMTGLVTGSPVPVVVYVAPAGARAASAGFFLLLAADVAAMAPGTNTGAAHPVAIGGGGEGKQQDTAIAKATEDAAALARALAEQRQRPVAHAVAAVTRAKAYSAEQARKLGLVELVAPSRAELLERLDGRTVRRWNGESVRLSTSGAQLTTLEPTVRERILMRIASPDLAYLLLMVGVLGLSLELFNPGLYVPAIVGVVCLLLGLYAFSVLPVRAAGAALIVVGIGLLVAEAFVTSYGLLAVAGAGAFVLGSLLLIDSPLPDLRIGPAMVVPSGALLALVALGLGSRALRSRRQPVLTGVEALVGRDAEVEQALDPEGRVFVAGESWPARSPGRAVAKGTRVRVVRVLGNLLEVEPRGLEGSKA